MKKTEGFSVDRLRRLDQFLQDEYVGPGRVPGIDLLVTRNGLPVHRSVMGLRDVERRLPVSDETLYRIYSMTKPVTSVAFMTLVEEGRVALDDPVSKYLPDWAGIGVQRKDAPLGVTDAPATAMRIVDLLRHSSGLTYEFQRQTVVDAAYRERGIGDPYGALNRDEILATLGQLPLDFHPGEAWNYSLSTDVLGFLIERITGQSLGSFFQERIFQPLGMRDTGFVVRDDQRDRFAACYTAVPDGGTKLCDDPADSPYLSEPTFESGGGGLVSTTPDYLRFATMLLNGGSLDGRQILAPKTLKLMTANHLHGGRSLPEMSRSASAESVYAGLGFGLGFAVVIDPARTLVPCSMGEFHWGGAASTVFWVDPLEKIVAIFMCQLRPSSAYRLRPQLRTLIYSSLVDSAGRPSS